MWQIVLHRLALGAVTLVVVSVLIFLGVQLLPGDVATEVLGQSATPEAVEAIRRSLGLDVPLHSRYFAWLGRFLSGDLGTSLASGRAISEILLPRLFNTAFLAAFTAVLAVPIAILGGLLCAVYRDSLLDRALNIVTIAAISVPEFLVAYLLILWLAVQTGIFPAISDVTGVSDLSQRLHATVLPALTLTCAVVAYMMRMCKVSLISVLDSQFIETARLKGLSEWTVLARHAMPNAIGPIASVVALNLAYLMTGVVIIEVIFVYPGIGQLMVDSVTLRDVPIVQVCTLIFASTYVILNFLADIVSMVSNPRVRYPR